jgi:G3E family GTPase
MDMIPVNIISGFLGAGKTTAIIKLMQFVPAGKQWAVIVNEFGKISIDGKTVLDSGAEPGQVYNIQGGCICCTAERFFHTQLEAVVQSGKFHRIIIEPSGLGGLDMVLSIIKQHEKLEKAHALCMVDLKMFERPALKRNMLYKSQIDAADAVVFSKLDLIAQEQECQRLVENFTSQHPEKTIFRGAGQDVFDFLLSGTTSKTALAGHRHDLENASEAVAPGYQQECFTFPGEKVFDVHRLQKALRGIPGLVRAKGFIRTTGGWIAIQYTLSGFHMQQCPGREANSLVVIVEKEEKPGFNVYSRINQAALQPEVSNSSLQGKP